MANLPEQARWESGIYQLETTDPVMGGVDGVDNKQAKQLANRTLYLKQEVEKRAPTANPTFTGSPKAPTPASGSNDTSLATTAFVKAAIAALVGSAPATLDTLAEIATALGADGNVKATLLAEIAKKANASHNHSMSQITDFELKALTTENLNDVKKAGMYKQDSTPNSTTARNYPEATAGALLVLPSAFQWMQIYIAHNTRHMFVRNLTAGNTNWSNWVRVDGIDKANLASPNFTGVPTAPTAAANTNNTQIATTAFVQTAIAALVGSAPEALNTLAEIATALGSDGNLKATLLAEIGKKANSSDFNFVRNFLVGIPFPYPLAAVPSGCLAFNGQTFNKSTYPELAKKYPSGKLPDLRGEFIRGWDNGRNVDTGRGILTEQGDAKQQSYVEFQHLDIAQSSLLNLSGDVTGETWQWSSVSQRWEKITNSQFNSYVLTPSSVAYASQSSQGIQLNDTLQKLWIGTGNETRPRNVAFQYICLAK